MTRDEIEKSMAGRRVCLASINKQQILGWPEAVVVVKGTDCAVLRTLKGKKTSPIPIQAISELDSREV